ncbi:DUF222 domain-containing protein [Amycolatopsis sp. NPDC058986]|uniref:HNH endonuclease signature motif containing protein n=1 Tax=unclassified Amycolatopsis TaxID=2618356 RepID=UPI00366D1797
MSENPSTLEPPQELWRRSGRELADEVRTRLESMWRLDAELGQFLVEIDSRGASELYGYRSTAAWFAHLGRMSRGEAKKYLDRAHGLNPGRNIDGTELPADAAATGTAALDGEIGPHHSDRILHFLKKVPSFVSEEDRSSAEKILVELARHATPQEVAKAADEILARMDQDGKPPKDPTPSDRKPELRLRQRKDGWFDIDGQLDPITGVRLSTVLDPLATPRPAGEEKWPDLRSPSQRYGEAFGEAIAMLANTPDAPGGDRAQLLVTVTLEDLKSQLGTACLDMVSKISATEARVLACDCQVIPAVLGSQGEPLDLGRAKRLVTPALRKALVIRDGGCAFPGCRRKPRHCDAHHVLEWVNGGLTVLRNFVLLCGAHHRLLHHAGWSVRVAEDGLPEFIPPDYLDPLRRPRRNVFHVADRPIAGQQTYQSPRVAGFPEPTGAAVRSRQ